MMRFFPYWFEIGAVVGVYELVYDLAHQQQ